MAPSLPLGFFPGLCSKQGLSLPSFLRSLPQSLQANGMFPLKPMSPIPSVTLLSKTQIPDCHLDAQDPAFLLHSLSRPAKCFASADKALGFSMISLLSHPLLPRCILRAKTCHPLVSPQLPGWGFTQSELLGNMQGRGGSRKGPQELDSLPTGSIAPSV